MNAASKSKAAFTRSGRVECVDPRGKAGADDQIGDLERELTEAVSQALDLPVLDRVTPLAGDSAQADSVAKLLARDKRGRPVAVALVSSPAAPGMVARSMARAGVAREMLGPELGRVILGPIREGEVRGRSYAILPYCRPLSTVGMIRRMQRMILGPALLNWLRQATAKTAKSVEAAEIDDAIVTPLTHLIGLESTSAQLSAIANRALDRLRDGRWIPRHVLMHNDLWLGNVLIAGRRTLGFPAWSHGARFVIIDWPGAVPRGYPIYDLLRLSQSLCLRKSRLATEISRHCRSLECTIRDAESYLAAALGHLAMNLECFPLNAFVNLADSTMHRLLEAVDEERA